MIINGKNYLLLEKRGCNFNGGVPVTTKSDVGNYRVCTMGETVPGKDGRNYFLEFSLWQNRSQPRYTNKRVLFVARPHDHSPSATYIRTALPYKRYRGTLFATPSYNQSIIL